MDYKAFYAEVADWIYQSNQMAVKHGLASEEFWHWVTSSASSLCNSYNNNPLVKKQMIMLCDWLEEIYQNGKSQT